MKARGDISEAISNRDNAHIEKGVVAIPRFSNDLAKRVSHHVARVIGKRENRHGYREDSQTKPQPPRRSSPSFFVGCHSLRMFFESGTIGSYRNRTFYS